MPKPYSSFTDAEWERLYRKVMGKPPAGYELNQFKKNYLKPTDYRNERQDVPEVEEGGEIDPDVRPRNSFNHRLN